MFTVCPEEQGESTDSIVLNVANENLEEGLTEVDIERVYRVEKPYQNKKKPRSIIIKFVRDNCRRRIFFKEKETERHWNIHYRKFNCQVHGNVK